MPAGNPIYGKGYHDGSEDGYSKGYDEGATIWGIVGLGIGAGITGLVTWVAPKVKAVRRARHLKRLEENPPEGPDVDDTDEGGPVE